MSFLILASVEPDDVWLPTEKKNARALKKDLPKTFLQYDSLLGLYLGSRPAKVKRAGESSSSSSSSGKKNTNKKFVASLKSVLYQGKEKSSKSSKREGRNGATNQPTPDPILLPFDPLFTLFPTSSRFTSQPTIRPTTSPVEAPVLSAPTSRPTSQTIVTTSSPTTSSPTSNPTSRPTTNDVAATSAPTLTPTVGPTTNDVAAASAPTLTPTVGPTTGAVTSAPTFSPTDRPTETGATTGAPTLNPTVGPTNVATVAPTTAPTMSPTQPGTLPPTAGDLDPFDITFTFVDMTLDGENLVRSSAARWESVVLSGEDSASGVGVTSTFDFAQPLCTYPDEIDDLHICSGVFAAISDGVGGALAFGGAERTRANGVPFTGLMAFDPADQSSLDSTTVLHEMGHGKNHLQLCLRTSISAVHLSIR